MRLYCPLTVMYATVLFSSAVTLPLANCQEFRISLLKEKEAASSVVPSVYTICALSSKLRPSLKEAEAALAQPVSK